MLDVATLRELRCKKLLTPRLRRKAAAWAMTETSHSPRRACALVGMDPKTYRYESRRPDDAGIRKRLRDIGRAAPTVRLPPSAHPAGQGRHPAQS